MIVIHGYNHSYGDGVETVKPSCTEEGELTYKCDTCGYLKHVATTKTPHDYSSVTPVDPTCEDEGYTVHMCIFCGDKYYTDYTDKLGHSYVPVSKDASCEENGYTANDCLNCDSFIVITTEEAYGHDYGELILYNPGSCTQDAEYRRYCSHDESHYTSEYVTIGHSYSDEWTIDREATCTETGLKSHHCKNCEAKTDITEIPAKGHRYGEWTQTVAPGCETEGEERRDCNNCDHYETKEIAALGHNYGEWIEEEPATCEGEGTLGHYHCVTCEKDFDAEKNELTTIVIPALGHTESEWIVDKEAAVGLKGHKHTECTVCGETLKEEKIPALTKPQNSSSSEDLEDPDSNNPTTPDDIFNSLESLGCFGSIHNKTVIMLMILFAVMLCMSKKAKFKEE